MQDQSMRKNFFFGLFIAGAILTSIILWPFAKVIILAIALSSVLFPIYSFLKKHIKFNWIASLLTIVLFIVVLCVPLFIVGTLIFKQSDILYSWVANHGGLDNITRLFNTSIHNVFPSGSIDLKDSITSLTARFTTGIGSVFSATLTTLFSFLLVILSMFYFLKDGVDWKKVLIHLIPLSNESGDKIFNKMNNAINGIVKGYLFIALIQGILMGVGLTIFGVPNAALWGLFAAVASLIPTVGTALVSIPVILFLVIAGRSGAAIGFAIWATALVGTIDNFLNPYFVGKKINIHPLLVLFSVLGGIALMGPIGILIGPLSVSFMYALTSVYKTEISGQ